jgi:molecular chaperone IbpA
MTRIQKEFDDIINTLLFPTRYTKTFNNVGASYPPYNIIKVSENETVLEVAVAGFKEDEVNVVVEDGYLRISGKKENTDVATYLYKGIGTRAFEKAFALSKDAKVDHAEYDDGILSIFVKYEVPEEKKPKQIPISKGERIYLTEKSDIV